MKNFVSGADMSLTGRLFRFTHPENLPLSFVYGGQSFRGIPAAFSPALYERTVVINGWSKAYAMTGWRLGYAAAPRDLAAAMAAYQSHAAGCPCSVSQAAGLAALEGDQACVGEMARAFEGRRAKMAEAIQKMPLVSCVLPRGAFYMMLNVRALMGRSFGGRIIHSGADFADLLLAHAHVAVVDGAAFGAEGYCRLSFAASEERIMEAMERMARFIRALV